MNYKFLVFSDGAVSVDLSLTPGGVLPVVHISQYDDRRRITFYLDEAVSLTDCMVEGTRADGGTVSESATHTSSSNVVTWTPSLNFTQKKGDVLCELVFGSYSPRIGSANFILRVEPAGADRDAPVAGSTVTITEPGTYYIAPYDRVIVDVEAPNGGIILRSNGTYDVTKYETAHVNVPSQASGTFNINANGDYDISSYAGVHVAVPTGGGGGTVADMELLANISAAASDETYDIDMTAYPISKTRDYAFYACKALKSVKIDVKTVGSSSFESCTAMQSVHLYNTQNINSGAFRGCYSLASLYLHGSSVASLSSVSVLNSTTIADGTGTIYVPSNLVDSYKAATNWSTFADQFQAIP